MPRPYRVGERQTQIALLVDHRVRLSGTTPTAELDPQRPCRRLELRPRPIVRQARRLRALHPQTSRLRRTLRPSRAGWAARSGADGRRPARSWRQTARPRPRCAPPPAIVRRGPSRHRRRPHIPPQEWPVPRPAAAMPTPARCCAVAPDASASRPHRIGERHAETDALVRHRALLRPSAENDLQRPRRLVDLRVLGLLDGPRSNTGGTARCRRSSVRYGVASRRRRATPTSEHKLQRPACLADQRGGPIACYTLRRLGSLHA